MVVHHFGGLDQITHFDNLLKFTLKMTSPENIFFL